MGHHATVISKVLLLTVLLNACCLCSCWYMLRYKTKDDWVSRRTHRATKDRIDITVVWHV